MSHPFNYFFPSMCRMWVIQTYSNVILISKIIVNMIKNVEISDVRRFLSSSFFIKFFVAKYENGWILIPVCFVIAVIVILLWYYFYVALKSKRNFFLGIINNSLHLTQIYWKFDYISAFLGLQCFSLKMYLFTIQSVILFYASFTSMWILFITKL